MWVGAAFIFCRIGDFLRPRPKAIELIGLQSTFKNTLLHTDSEIETTRRDAAQPFRLADIIRNNNDHTRISFGMPLQLGGGAGLWKRAIPPITDFDFRSIHPFFRFPTIALDRKSVV